MAEAWLLRVFTFLEGFLECSGTVRAGVSWSTWAVKAIGWGVVYRLGLAEMLRVQMSS